MSQLDIPGYSVQRVLGKGGMATVYLALQEKFEREVALKVMAPALSADEGFRERFLREAKIVAKISHPNIVAVYDVNEVNGCYYIAMEYHPGGDLKTRLRDGVSVREAVNILRDIAKALDYAHSKGYLHRDIKPDNILFRVDGSAVLTDFGIAKATEGDANLTQMGMVAGTPKYMSPEQARGQVLDADSDLYSLGVVFFEMLAGRLPYEATDPIALGIQHMNAPIPKLEGRAAHFQPLIDRLLAKNPAQRPQNGTQLVRELDAIEKGFDYDNTLEQDAHNQTMVRPSLRKTSTPPASPMKSVGDAVTVMAPAQPLPSRQSAPAEKPELLVLPSPRAAKSPPGKIMAIAAVLALLAGGGWWMQEQRQAQQQQERLVSALAAGKAAFARADYVSSPDDNALLHYREVLALDPENQIAKSALAEMQRLLVQQVQAALTQHDLVRAEYLIAQLQALPAEASVTTALQQQVSDIRAAKARLSSSPVTDSGTAAVAKLPAERPTPVKDGLIRLRIAGLLGSARQALEEGDTATAVQRYQQVLKFDPQNREAKAGLRQAASR